MFFCISCVHFRHPLELGGIYFFANALVSIASWFAAAVLYSRYYHELKTELPSDADMNTAVAKTSAFVNSTSTNIIGVNSTGDIL